MHINSSNGHEGIFHFWENIIKMNQNVEYLEMMSESSIVFIIWITNDMEIAWDDHNTPIEALQNVITWMKHTCLAYVYDKRIIEGNIHDTLYKDVRYAFGMTISNAFKAENTFSMFCGGYGFINPLRAKFFRGNINIYLHFMSLLHIDLTQVLQMLPQVRPGPTYSA